MLRQQNQSTLELLRQQGQATQQNQQLIAALMRRMDLEEKQGHRRWSSCCWSNLLLCMRTPESVFPLPPPGVTVFGNRQPAGWLAPSCGLCRTSCSPATAQLLAAQQAKANVLLLVTDNRPLLRIPHFPLFFRSSGGSHSVDGPHC